MSSTGLVGSKAISIAVGKAAFRGTRGMTLLSDGSPCAVDGLRFLLEPLGGTRTHSAWPSSTAVTRSATTSAIALAMVTLGAGNNVTL